MKLWMRRDAVRPAVRGAHAPRVHRSAPRRTDEGSTTASLSSHRTTVFAARRRKQHARARALPGDSAARGFTLIELVVVITVIVILMALLFPAFKGVQDQAKRTQAKNDITQVVTAINSYYTEYGKMPVDGTKQGFDTLLGDPGGSYDNHIIFDVLRAISDSDWNSGNVLNPKQIIFFNGANVKDGTNPRSGIATQDATVNGVTIKKDAFVDPWGGEYLVSVDADYDGWTQDFIPYSDLTYTSKTGGSGTHPAVQATATSSSWGKDAKLGTNGDGKYKDSDDVISWQ